jgi:hypothetical protein
MNAMPFCKLLTILSSALARRDLLLLLHQPRRENFRLTTGMQRPKSYGGRFKIHGFTSMTPFMMTQ